MALALIAVKILNKFRTTHDNPATLRLARELLQPTMAMIVIDGTELVAYKGDYEMHVPKWGVSTIKIYRTNRDDVMYFHIMWTWVHSRHGRAANYTTPKQMRDIGLQALHTTQGPLCLEVSTNGKIEIVCASAYATRSRKRTRTS